MRRMAGLDWKSDSAATVVRPSQKGTGDSPKRHLWGKILGMPESIFRFGHFFARGV